MKTINLTQGKVAIVDDDIYEKISSIKWYCHHGYAVGWVDKKKVIMHRFVMNANKGQEIDHKNGNKCDNRRENLRFCTRSQNKANVGPNANGTSGYKGVHWSALHNKFRARIGVNGKRYHLGLYTLAEDAARAYNDAAKKYFGEFAQLNEVTWR